MTKDTVLQIRISTEEKAEIVKLADALGVKLSDIVRAGIRFMNDNPRIARAEVKNETP